MQPLCGVLLLLLICQLATPIPIFDRDGVGFRSGHRSAGFGETVRDWFRVLKNRIVRKWNEWFGDDTPTPSLSPQDILNIDRTLEKRIQGYPGFFLDLSDLSYDPKQDWGVRIGNWHIIRKIAGDYYEPDSDDSDEWDVKSLMPVLPSPPILTYNWPNIQGFDEPKATRPPTTTQRIEFTTPQQQTPRIRIEPTVSTTIGSTVSTLEPTTTPSETILPDTQTTPTEPTVTSIEQTSVSNEITVTNSEPSTPTTTASTESALMTTETVTTPEPIVLTTEIIATSTEPIITSTELNVSSTELTPTSSEPTILTSTESVTNTLEPTATSTESMLSIESVEVITESIIIEETETTTISSTTSAELLLPVYNKRIEDNETIKKPTTKPNNRRSSAEVIMF